MGTVQPPSLWTFSIVTMDTIFIANCISFHCRVDFFSGIDRDILNPTVCYIRHSNLYSRHHGHIVIVKAKHDEKSV